jgi:hypothetical protein
MYIVFFPIIFNENSDISTRVQFLDLIHSIALFYLFIRNTLLTPKRFFFSPKGLVNVNKSQGLFYVFDCIDNE